MALNLNDHHADEGRSRSFIWLLMFDFLLVNNSNLSSISHRFRDILDNNILVKFSMSTKGEANL